MVKKGEMLKTLTGMVDTGRIPHAMLFYENDGGGAFPIILAFLQYLFSKQAKEEDKTSVENKIEKLIHSDIHFIFPVTSGGVVSGASSGLTSDLFLQYWRELLLANPYFLEADLNRALGFEGKSGIINVAEAKSIISKLSLASVEGGYRAVVIYLPESMNVNAANKLLKIIEEPPHKTLFLMITHNPGHLLQTIVSRCQAFRITPKDKEDITNILVDEFKKDKSLACQAAGIANGSVGVALDYLSEKSNYHANLDLFADLMASLLKRNLLEALEVSDVLVELKSRERQKEFCNFAGESLRKIFFLQKGLTDLAPLTEEEYSVFSDYSKKCGKQFCRKALSVFNEVHRMLDRNVNQKILFCDMVNRLFFLIR